MRGMPDRTEPREPGFYWVVHHAQSAELHVGYLMQDGTWRMGGRWGFVAGEPYWIGPRIEPPQEG